MPPAVKAAAEAEFDLTLRGKTTPMLPAELVASLREYDMVMPTLGDRYSSEVFAAVPRPRCRLLANFGMGYNHIDVLAAQAAGVAVTNTPGAVTDATADIGVMLMLMSARRASEGERMVRAGRWAGWHPTEMLGLHLTGKTVGILGMGRIGRAVARRCQRGFDMQVVFFNRSPVPDPGVPAEQLPTLHEVMARADVVVVTMAATPETRHLIDAAALAAMQPHAHLVNIARGDLVDEAALIAALEAGQIAGAGLDVYEHEPQVPEALRRLENVSLLPHLGTATHEVREAMGMVALDNLRAFAAGQPLPNRV
ncbi:2-hydroxyacid dehydrogenase [Alkalilacustris brevis]|uniref:2-hydroxyacid dehydrogenase n=1 Tax=Alkalilacustris brevis TaxID=2026338 RepID=UPI000E0DE68D